jgi:hypothetical protein
MFLFDSWVPLPNGWQEASRTAHQTHVQALPTRKAPATSDKVAAMVALAGDGPRGLRDRALLLLGFAGAFRRSELVALNLEDLEFCERGLRDEEHPFSRDDGCEPAQKRRNLARVRAGGRTFPRPRWLQACYNAADRLSRTASASQLNSQRYMALYHSPRHRSRFGSTPASSREFRERRHLLLRALCHASDTG